MSSARLALLVGVLFAFAPAAHAGLSVSNDRAAIATKLGHKLVFHSTILNDGTAPAGGLVAHLNVVDLSGHTYVDPEDWSSARSQQLSLKAGESRKLSWEIQAVNAGLFAAYVVVVPFGNTVNGNEDLSTSPLIRVDVAQRTTLTAGGALPVVLAVPLLIGLAAATVLVRVRRRRA